MSEQTVEMGTNEFQRALSMSNNILKMLIECYIPETGLRRLQLPLYCLIIVCQMLSWWLTKLSHSVYLLRT